MTNATKSNWFHLETTGIPRSIHLEHRTLNRVSEDLQLVTKSIKLSVCLQSTTITSQTSAMSSKSILILKPKRTQTSCRPSGTSSQFQTIRLALLVSSVNFWIATPEIQTVNPNFQHRSWPKILTLKKIWETRVLRCTQARIWFQMYPWLRMESQAPNCNLPFRTESSRQSQANLIAWPRASRKRLLSFTKRPKT